MFTFELVFPFFFLNFVIEENWICSILLCIEMVELNGIGPYIVPILLHGLVVW